MEDFPTEPSDNETTTTSKRRFLRGNFFASWLQHRQLSRQSETLSNDNENDEETYEKKDTKQSGFLNKLVKSVRGLFKKQIRLDLLPVSVAADRSIPYAERIKSEVPTPETNQNEEYIEGGLLPVSDDAIRRYQSETEPQDENGLGDYEISNPELSPVPALVQKQETDDKLKVDNYVESSTSELRETSNSQALSTGEILQRRREKRLKREVSRLKREAVSAKKERQTVKKQQKDFQEKLVRQEQINQEVLNRRLPKLEQSPSELPQVSRIEQLPKPYKIADEIPSLKPSRDILPELQSEKIKELVNSKAGVRPEIILRKVETAAEHNIPIESLYERRHEIKDEQPPESYVAAKSSGAASALAAQYNRLRQAYAHSNLRTVTPLIPQPSPKTTQNSNLYKQAAQSGFWGGVAVCILLIIILLIH